MKWFFSFFFLMYLFGCFGPLWDLRSVMQDLSLWHLGIVTVQHVGS